MTMWRRVCSSDAGTGVDEDHREVRGRAARDHVPGVLEVAGRVGDDELAPGRREVAVGDVDRDPLLPLGAQAVGQEGEVEPVAAAASRRDARAPPSWSSKIPFESWSSRPISVLLPSSTEPAVENRSRSDAG